MAVTADELMERLHADPEWVARNREREKKRQALAQRLAENEAPLLAALKGVGLRLESVYDLVNTGDSYPEAIPVLLEHLKKYDQYDLRIREGIARALIVREARPVQRELIDAFLEDPDSSLNGPKSALANAITLNATPAQRPEIISLALEQTHGKGRWPFVDWLRRRKGPEIDRALETLASDPVVEISLSAKAALKKRSRKKT